MTPRSRYSAWRYPAFWPKKAILPFVVLGLLLALIPHAGQFSLQNDLNFQQENNQAFAQAILTAKLASVPNYVWLRRLNCELQPRPGCTPAKLFFSEGQSLHSDLSIRVEKECKICHTNSAEVAVFRFKGQHSPEPLSDSTVYYSSGGLFFVPILLFFGIVLSSREKDLVYGCLFHRSLEVKKQLKKRRKVFQKSFKPLYMEEHSQYLRIILGKKEFQKITERGNIQDLIIDQFSDLEDVRLVFTQEEAVQGFPISPESLKSIGSLSVQAKPGYVILEQSLIQKGSEAVMNLQPREALWKGKRGKNKRFLIYPIKSEQDNDTKELT